MPPIIRLSKVAQADLNEIVDFYLANTSKQLAEQVLNQLLAEIRLLVNNPLLGLIEPQLASNYKIWLALEAQYRIIFKRPNHNTLKVIMIRSIQQSLPTAAELKKANKS